MILEVTAGNLIDFRVATVSEMTLSASILDLLGKQINGVTDINSATAFVFIGFNAGGIEYQVDPADTHEWFINTVSEMILNDTELNLQNNKLANINPSTIIDLTTVTGVAGDFVWIIDATDGLSKKVDVTDFLAAASQTPWTSQIDAASNSLINFLFLEDNSTNPAVTT